jgi:hypothetical protein
MMNIGLTGGSSLCIVGSIDEVESFFARVKAIAPHISVHSSLITDRLYRRYLRLSELEEATSTLLGIVDALSRTVPDAAQSAFAGRFLRCFNSCVESAKLNYEAFRDTEGYEYEPVRLVIADQPWFTAEKQRSLGEYDANDGAPFWARSQPSQRGQADNC